MVSIPNIRVAKPRRIMPVSLCLPFPINMNRMIPATAITGTKEDGFKSWTQMLSLLTPLRLRIQAVMVVPTLDPMITLMACFRVIRPELTKPTTITVVADELWITAVIPQPVRKPDIFPVVMRSSMFRRPGPALLSRACPIMFMPNRNRQSPPARVRTSNIVIKKPPLIFHCVYTTIMEVFCKIDYLQFVKSV